MSYSLAHLFLFFFTLYLLTYSPYCEIHRVQISLVDDGIGILVFKISLKLIEAGCSIRLNDFGI